MLPVTDTWVPTIANCDAYLDARTGAYRYRAIRYRAAAEVIEPQDTDTIVDVGAGWTEFDFCLRREYDWLGRYIPVDGGVDGTDLNFWSPARDADWFVALEVIEHVWQPMDLIDSMKPHAKKGIVISTPNPLVVDVIGMDPTHVSIIQPQQLEDAGFAVEWRNFYGQEGDSLFGVWLA